MPKDEPRLVFGAKPMHIHVELPSRIKSASAKALLTLHGQLYCRVEST